MKRIFNWIVLCFLVNMVNTNQTSIYTEIENKTQSIPVKKDNNDLGKNSSKTIIMNMNIIGNNVEVNFDQNNKKVSLNSTSSASNPNNIFKPNKSSQGLKVDLGDKLIYPDYLVEVDPPNSREVFSRRISKRSDDLNSIDVIKDLKKYNSTKYLELSVFVDFKAKQNIKTIGLIETDEEFHELILCYINQIEAIYSHKSFYQNFSINLVKIEIQKTDIFSKSDGNRDELLKEFCKYQSSLNPISDTDPLHWDMALLLTGYDLFVLKDDGTRDYKSLGLGSVSGICTLDRNCVISEFEAINTFGELWPSSGLMSAWAAAHEMAHNLGILHDGWPFNLECPSNGYLMSGSRGTRGETNWSKCSANNFEQSYTDCLDDKPIFTDQTYNHNKYKWRAGALWNADIQCKLFLRDRQAFEFPKTMARICNETILCATPHRLGYYSSGPALEGTECGDNQWCVDGLCQPKDIDNYL